MQNTPLPFLQDIRQGDPQREPGLAVLKQPAVAFGRDAHDQWLFWDASPVLEEGFSWVSTDSLSRPIGQRKW